MDLQEIITKGLADVTQKINDANEKTGTEVKSLNDQLSTLTQQVEAAKNNGVSLEVISKMQEHLDLLDIKLQKKNTGTIENKTFNEYLGETLQNATDELKSFSRKNSGELTLNLKAAGDMSAASNFGGIYGNLTTEFRSGLLPERDATIYLRDIIPAGTTDAASIWYPQANGGEGSPTVWAEGTTKPIFDFDFVAKNMPVQWIAGIVKVPRSMLDDVKFLTSYLQANMLKSLYKAENNEILNGDGTGVHLSGLLTNADEYDGSMTELVEKLIDASYGQLAEKGHQVSNIVLNARDAVEIALRKSSGSSEYNLPGGTGFINGRLTIGGVPVLSMPTTQMASGNFLVGDFSATQLITRLNPEIRFFEQNNDDVEKNMITIRIEERVVLATYYKDAFVKKATV